MNKESLEVREALEGYYKVEEKDKTVWYQPDGQIGRKYGPAIEGDDGYKQWWVDGKRHRLDGPALEWADGTKEWWVDGKRHREDGPAVEWADGTKEWFVDGKRLTEEEFNQRVVKGIVS